jgi:hypothetical protein
MTRTTVEWLEIHLLGVISFDSEELREKYKSIIKQSKEMEKARSIDFFEKGCFYPKPIINTLIEGEKVYEETYKK